MQVAVACGLGLGAACRFARSCCVVLCNGSRAVSPWRGYLARVPGQLPLPRWCLAHRC